MESAQVKRSPKKVVILGAGIGGLRVALKLEKKIDPDSASILLVDENEYHQYMYNIHKVCGPEYDPKDIIVPIQRVIKGKNIGFQRMKVEGVEPERRVFVTSETEIPFDVLVIALGSHAEYYGIEGVKENSLTLDSFESAKRIRQAIGNLFTAFRGKERPPEIVICGGGFTGTELAGELSDWLPALFKSSSLKHEKIATLVEAMPTILPGWDPKLVERAQRVLRSREIELILGDPVSQVTGESVVLRSGRIVDSDLTIWTGGVTCDPACGSVFEIRSRRICIDDYCRAKGFGDIYVVGDDSCALDGKTGQPLPPSAHIAIAQADIVAHNICASMEGGEMKRYVGGRAGEIVTLGGADAVGKLYGIRLTGIIARIVKLFIHWWYVYSIGGLRLLFG